MAYHVHPNAKRWLKPPTIEQIDAAVKASGTSEPKFEAFYGLSLGCIAKVRCGFRQMPVKHWHIFLEDTKTNIHKPLHRSNPISVPSKPRVKNDTRISGLV